MNERELEKAGLDRLEAEHLRKGAERILIIDDDPSVAQSVEMLLSMHNYRCTLAATGQQGLDRYEAGEFDLVITDLRLPDMTGLDVIQTIKRGHPHGQIILMTSYSSVDTAVEAMRRGAHDYIIKPFDNDDFLFSVQRALDLEQVRRENASLKRSLQSLYQNNVMIGDSPVMKRVLEIIKRVAPANVNVLIQGESGTGKELVAQAIHLASPRAEGPFIAINCGAIPRDLLESELFGHTKGAFTGATSSNEGLIRAANGGTLFLDEISEMPAELQVKLLRVLQERQVRPLGAKNSFSIDVRFIAASNRNLKEAIANETFRGDLYYRLNVINIQVPALRERGKDISLLAQHFIEKYSRQLGKGHHVMSKEFNDFLYQYDWPGNVRELENLIERAIILADSEVLTCKDLTDTTLSPCQGFTETAIERALSIEEYIQAFVRHYQGEYSETELAAMLGIGRKALWQRRTRWGLSRNGAARDSHQAAKT